MKRIARESPVRQAAHGAEADEACELCGSRRRQVFAEEAGFHLLRCPVCRLIAVSPKPQREALADRYAREIHGRDDYWAGYVAKEAAFRDHGRYVLRLISRTIRPPGRLLEIGCGPGFFLAEANSIGWRVSGVELAEPFAAWGRKNLGVDVRRGELESQRFPAASFDAAVMLDVLSHLPSPWHTLSEINRVLRPAGVLFLQAGNKAEAAVKRPGDDWGTPLHLFHFTRGTIRRMLCGAGFEVLEVHVAPRLSVPAAGRRLGRCLPFARALYRNVRRVLGALCGNQAAPDSTVYVVARKT
jgi:SAM-dependent methyltransferase